MAKQGEKPETHRPCHALILGDDLLVAAYMAGVLLDYGITADSVMVQDFAKYILRRRYDVAVVDVDRKSGRIALMVRLLQQCGVGVVLFSVLGDPQRFAAQFPELPMCCYEPRHENSIAVKVLSAAGIGLREARFTPARGQPLTRH
ncbi:MAG TPA: hypothetical protein VGO17_04320 [Aurantimonas sp.]|jgi:hypothetical protein|nr:hypothetical protein [Aurantimonas sp.]